MFAQSMGGAAGETPLPRGRQPGRAAEDRPRHRHGDDAVRQPPPRSHERAYEDNPKSKINQRPQFVSATSLTGDIGQSRDVDQIGGIARAQLVHGPGAMEFDGDQSDVELIGDFLVKQPVHHQAHDFPLARGE